MNARREYDEEPAGGPDGPHDGDRLRPTRPGFLLGWLLAGLVGGWLVRPSAVQLGVTAPQVSWLQVAALLLVAAVLGIVARATHVSLQQRRAELRPHEAVNRLVLARSCAVAGALFAGGYLGYALSWVGISAELGSERITHSLLAAAGAVLTVVASLLLERACRVRGGDEES